ncbi:MAG: hypothetical protein DWC07_06090 [Candidatus Poseidoniales archaeon]|nr:MAG: hypothetical protein DWC07_06090 [Candidatus Poseidoniales archaeon]
MLFFLCMSAIEWSRLETRWRQHRDITSKDLQWLIAVWMALMLSNEWFNQPIKYQQDQREP